MLARIRSGVRQSEYTSYTLNTGDNYKCRKKFSSFQFGKTLKVQNFTTTKNLIIAVRPFNHRQSGEPVRGRVRPVLPNLHDPAQNDRKWQPMEKQQIFKVNLKAQQNFRLNTVHIIRQLLLSSKRYETYVTCANYCFLHS